MKHPAFSIITIVLMTLASTQVSAQSVVQLQAENSQLRQQLQTLQRQCSPATSPDQQVSQAGKLQAHIASLRIGPASGYQDSHIAVTVAMTLTNTSDRPMALNYERQSYSVTDDNGHEYKLSNEHLSEAAKQDVKGIPIATPSRASVNQILAPGGSSTVTFIARRSMRKGQTPGTLFDVQATFGQYRDEGQGRIQKVGSYPVAFTGIGAGSNRASGAAHNPATGTGTRLVEDAASRLFERIVK